MTYPWSHEPTEADREVAARLVVEWQADLDRSYVTLGRAIASALAAERAKASATNRESGR